MNIMKLVYQEYRVAFLSMLLLTLLSGLLGIGVLSFINQYLLQLQASNSHIIGQFVALILAYLLLSTVAQIALAKLGQQFVYQMQARLIKQIMDSSEAQLQYMGKPRVFASLSNDTRTLSIAFARLPELVQGALFVLVCSAYLIYLSPPLFAVIAVLLSVMMISSHVMIRRYYQYSHKMRKAEDELYRHYATALDGHKELTLNRYRAARFYHQKLLPEAQQKRDDHIYADAYHALAINWSNSVMLAAVGIIFYLAVYHQWASLAEATTISMTVLFMRGQLTAAIRAIPAILQSQVAIDALNQLGLVPYQASFHQTTTLAHDWQTIRLENVTYHYPTQGGQSFALQPINLTLQRGETLFLIGANGSGKSTLSLVLAGLYPPSTGKIWVDDIEITDDNRSAYRQLFASVFTDFHLFEQLIDGVGQDVSEELLHCWLKRLQLKDKVLIEQHHILNQQLSQGQRKRLALLAAVLEQRSLLILDEWAADQDPKFRRFFYEKLLPLLKQQGYTIIAISHDDKYFHHAERIVSMKQGILSEYNTQDAIQMVDEHSR